jgi:hypothetical protein
MLADHLLDPGRRSLLHGRLDAKDHFLACDGRADHNIDLAVLPRDAILEQLRFRNRSLASKVLVQDRYNLLKRVCSLRHRPKASCSCEPSRVAAGRHNMSVQRARAQVKA